VPGRRFIIVDAAMNDLIRPTLYEAHHPIWLASPTLRPADPTPADVVGPICETGDILARARALPAIEAGDLLAIGATGAYGAVMASAYNSRALVPEVLAYAGVFSVVRPRVAVSEMIQQEQLPDWLS
jgi:diaminopimelate decarboxylase